MDKIKEKLWGAVMGFFGAALLLYIGSKLVLQVWWLLLIAALTAIGIIIYIRIKKGKPKY
jgi:energy-converting hydrogenase Eha subunit B